ncbi:MAG: GNAT family N-acetyltransferase, partial [Hyphococcus sp.]
PMSDLTNWVIRETPTLARAEGRFVRLDAARFPEDAAALFAAVGGPDNDDLWRYIPFGPPESADALAATMAFMHDKLGWRTQILRDAATGETLGMASYMRNRPEHGSTEVGCIVFSTKLQRTPAATEAMYLMARHVFDELGYRRYEWKCDNANEASKRAAGRFGFVFEGVFRQDMVVNGRNRDTAWYSITDAEWPAVKAAFETWLAPENFDGDGRQRRGLAALRAAL